MTAFFCAAGLYQKPMPKRKRSRKAEQLGGSWPRRGSHTVTTSYCTQYLLRNTPSTLYLLVMAVQQKSRANKMSIVGDRLSSTSPRVTTHSADRKRLQGSRPERLGAIVASPMFVPRSLGLIFVHTLKRTLLHQSHRGWSPLIFRVISTM
jgi:hypothetical protein